MPRPSSTAPQCPMRARACASTPNRAWRRTPPRGPSPPRGRGPGRGASAPGRAPRCPRCARPEAPWAGCPGPTRCHARACNSCQPRAPPRPSVRRRDRVRLRGRSGRCQTHPRRWGPRALRGGPAPRGRGQRPPPCGCAPGPCGWRRPRPQPARARRRPAVPGRARRCPATRPRAGPRSPSRSGAPGPPARPGASGPPPGGPSRRRPSTAAGPHVPRRRPPFS
mmetsp:Transcript_22106/g.66035  ORF Transcript_22106/g.66035 Transcript_22106/m.66035 type:complete len:223 (-) Transcript_22106:476-1144(-)